MKAERWQRVEQLLHAALEREESQRAVFLQEICAGDEVLRREVDSLLAQQKRAEHFIETAALEMAARALANNGVRGGSSGEGVDGMTGRMISRYRILRKLGAGGMGEVYRALHIEDQYQKQVAIKLIRAGHDTQYVLGRFKNERQILANLEHPNIARLMDVGSTEDGLPYFVMEIIEGQPIDLFCDSHRLSTVERVKLFCSVCSGIYYAHQHLVVHRDLKPANVLVTAEGVPKVLDFGIAKILESEHPPGAVEPTITVVQMMTPEYASPEQLRGEAITTASDIYSLGVLLYYLLTGHSPYRLATHSLHELAKAVCELEPEKPSTAISRIEERSGADGQIIKLTPELVSSTREGQPDKLRRRLAGDLDQIVLKAIRKEPARRYASVEQFSEDIRRHVEGRPVLAHKHTLGYRGVKFARRHRTGVIAGAVVALTLIAGMIAIVRESRIARIQQAKAQARFNDVHELANSLIFDINDALENVPGATTARKLLVSKALRYLDSLAKEASDDPSLLRELATAYQRLGDRQGVLNSPQNLGNTSEALDSYRKALKIREALVASQPTDLTARSELALTYRKIGELSAMRNDFAAAAENDRQALAAYEALSAVRANDAKASRDLAVAYYNIGRHLSMNADWVPASQNDLKALSILEPIAEANRSDKALSLIFAAFCRQTCYDLNKTSDRTKALDLCQKAVAINEHLATDNPSDVRVRQDLASSYDDLGAILSDDGDFAVSLRNWEKGLAIDKELATTDPKDARTRGVLAREYDRAGLLMVRTGVPDGVQYLRNALEIRKKLFADDAENWGRLEVVATSYAELGDTEASFASMTRIGRSKQIAHWREAQQWYKQALQIYTRLRDQGTLRAVDAGEPDRIAREIAKCDAVLRKAADTHFSSAN